MNRTATAVASAALLSALAACSAPQAGAPAPQSSAVVTPPAASQSGGGSGGMDGVYRSPTGPVSGNSRCGTSTFGYPIRVSGGVATLHTNTAGDISGPIAPDGSLMIEHGRQMLQGKFSGNQFSGMLNFNGCGYPLNYVKR